MKLTTRLISIGIFLWGLYLCAEGFHSIATNDIPGNLFNRWFRDWIVIPSDGSAYWLEGGLWASFGIAMIGLGIAGFQKTDKASKMFTPNP